MEILIREATEDDISPVIRLSKGAIRKAYGDFIPIDALQPWLAEGGESDKYIIMSVSNMYVAIGDSQVIGAVVIYDDLIDGMVVDVNFWSKGAGTALMEHAEQLIKMAGHSKAKLECFEPNHRTVGFYKKKGFSIQDKRMDPDAGVAKLLMEKSL
jgi:GNAT superfamily N-acetyltransferase